MMTSPTGLPARRRRPRQHWDHCPTSGKIRYRDAREATEALHRLTNRAAVADELGGQHSIRVKRKYRCTACRGWHLTSQEPRTGRGAPEQVTTLATATGFPAPRRPDLLLAALSRSSDLPTVWRFGLAA